MPSPRTALSALALTAAAVLVALTGSLPAHAASPEATIPAGSPESVFDGVEFDGVMYLRATGTPETGLVLWESDGQAFAPIAGSPSHVYMLTAAADGVYFVASNSAGTTDTVWSYNGDAFVEYVVEGPGPITALDGGGVALPAGPDRLLHTIINGAVTEVDGSPTGVIEAAVVGGTVYVTASSGLEVALLRGDAPGTFTPITGVLYPGIAGSVGDRLYIAGVTGLHFVDPGQNVATQVAGTGSPVTIPVIEHQGSVYASVTNDGQKQLVTVDGATATAVANAPYRVDRIASVGGKLLMGGAGADQVGPFFTYTLFALHEGEFVPVSGGALNPRRFFEFQGLAYFVAEVEGRPLGGLGANPALYVLDAPVAPAGPALAATGLETSAPIAVAVLLLLAGGVAMGIRRQATR